MSSLGVGRSIAGRVEATGGRTTGFDYLRIALAASVIIWHAFPLSYGPAFEAAVYASPVRPLVAFILPSFFSLSGFLVAGSLERNTSLLRFASLRAIRIVPALGVEVFLSALLLGPLLTQFSLPEYFADHKFHAYFLNVLGIIHFQLPGLFLDNPYPAIVNGQLWTIPSELECYMLLMVCAALGFVRRRPLLLLTYLILQVVLLAKALVPVLLSGAPLPSRGVFTGKLLVEAFLAGVLIYRFRDRVPFSSAAAAVALVLSIALLAAPMGIYLASAPVAYLTVWLGLQNPKSNVLVKFGDFSYGMYLYGFAIQQTVAQLGAWTHHWWLNLAIVMPCVTLFAAVSWYCIEKPALSLRKYLKLFDPLDAFITERQARVGKLMQRRKPVQPDAEVAASVNAE